MPKEKNAELFTEERHPDWYHPVPGMRALILGTFPPHMKHRSYEFYYPNVRNRLWKILAHIGRHELVEMKGEKAVLERKRIMKKLGVGIHNLGKRILRKGTSSLDQNIRIIEYQDILSVVKKNKKLEVIIIAGYSGKTGTYHAFIDYLKSHGVKFTTPKEIKAGGEFILHYGRPVRCVLVNSTSPAAFSVTDQMLIDQFSAFI